MADVQDSVLCPGSTPGTPITGVFVAVVHRSVTNNNNSIRSLFNLVFSIGHHNVSYKNRNSAGRHYQAACISEKNH